jgi:hypothetical protein
MSMYVTIFCNTCSSALAYGSACSTIYRGSDGREYQDMKCTIPYVPKPSIDKCKYCNSTDIFEAYDGDE